MGEEGDDGLFNKQPWENWIPLAEKDSGPCLAPHARVNQKWLEGLNVRAASVKCWKKHRAKLPHRSSGGDLPHRTPKEK